VRTHVAQGTLMVGTHRHRLQRPEEGFIEGAVRLVPRLDTTLAPRTGPAQERRPGQHLGPGEQRQRANPSLKTIVHAVWNRIESQSVTQGSVDACI